MALSNPYCHKILSHQPSSSSRQVTAAAEAQFGHVEIKLQQLRQGAPRLHRAATFYLTTAHDALKVERQRRRNFRAASTAATAAGATTSSSLEQDSGGHGAGEEGWSDMEASKAMKRRLWHALKAHSLYTELGDLWLHEAKQASKVCTKRVV